MHEGMWHCRINFILGVQSSVWAELSVASIFQDHAVMQRDMPIPVWGKGEPGAKVKVSFAGTSEKVKVNAEGRWMVSLKARKMTTKPQRMVVSSRGETDVTCSDLLIGDVWICSGQSNMQMNYNGISAVKALAGKIENVRSFEVERIVAFEEQENVGGSWTKDAPKSAVALSFAYHLQQKSGVPVGVIVTCWGSSSIEGWMPRDMVDKIPRFKDVVGLFEANDEFHTEIMKAINGPRPWPMKKDILMRRQPNIIYNAMMKPLAPYACQGIVWYQGEANAANYKKIPEKPYYRRVSPMLEYGNVLRLWMTRYRQEWNRDSMKFLVVMLPGYAKGVRQGPEAPNAPSWAWMREAQMEALQLGNVAVANTIDLGDLKNIHPKDKLPVGQRLALLANDPERKTAGPVMKSVQLAGDRLVIEFADARGLKTTDGAAPTAFWIAGTSKKWVRATAEIKGTSVVLMSGEVKKPLYVRYAFAGKPAVNLVNEAGLPAYPFRSDSHTL